MPLSMWLDLLALALLAGFALMGALRGAFATGMGLLTLVVSYAAAVLLAPVLGPALAEHFELPVILAYAVAGSGAFLAAYFVMGVANTLVRRFARRQDGVRTPRDRFLGAAFGTLRGALLVLVVSWLAIWVDALRETGTVELLPGLDGSKAAAVTSEVVESGVRAAASDERTGRVVARVAARPGATIVEARSLLEDSTFTALQDDALFWSYVEHGNVDAALNRVSFQHIIRDAPLRQRLADLGVIDEEAARDAGAFRAAAAEVLREVGPLIKGLKNDPEVQRLVEDPQVVAMLESGDTLGLIRHEGFRSLVDRVTSQQAGD
jgi:membrane protein required for colicin V production